MVSFLSCGLLLICGSILSSIAFSGPFLLRFFTSHHLSKLKIRIRYSLLQLNYKPLYCKKKYEVLNVTDFCTKRDGHSTKHGLDWTVGLDWTGLDWTGLDWTGLDWTGQLDWTGLDWTGLDWTVGLDWTDFNIYF